MNNLKFAAASVLVLAMATGITAQSFEIYPGATEFTPRATEDTKKAMEAMPPGTTESIYLTNDSFEKAAAFYKGFAKEYTMPYAKKRAKLPSGQELKDAYFFDGEDLMASKSWAKVQRPFVGSAEMKGMTPEYHDIHDVTVIVLVG
jgi:hypothetical protein